MTVAILLCHFDKSLASFHSECKPPGDLSKVRERMQVPVMANFLCNALRELSELRQ